MSKAKASDTEKNEAGIYSYATTWSNATSTRLSNGYAYAESEAEAKGKAVEVGQRNNPDCSMGALLVIKIEWAYHEALDAGMSEVAKLVGLVPEKATIEETVGLVRRKLATDARG